MRRLALACRVASLTTCTGSTGSSPPVGGAAPFVFACVATSMSHSAETATRPVLSSPILALPLSPLTDANPTTVPSAANTGPPALPTSKSNSAARTPPATRRMVPGAVVGCPNRVVPIAETRWPRSSTGRVCASQPSGSGFRPASPAGSTHSMARSRAASDAMTRAETFIVGENCTSTVRGAADHALRCRDEPAGVDDRARRVTCPASRARRRCPATGSAVPIGRSSVGFRPRPIRCSRFRRRHCWP